MLRLSRPPEITSPHRGHRKECARVHHSTILQAPDLAESAGIPTTAVPRTLLDLAGTVRERSLAAVLDRSERLALLDIGSINELLERSGHHRGRRKLRRAAELYRDAAFTRSRVERIFLELVIEAGLPRPSMNLWIAGHELDAYWPDERFAVEIDGWSTHGNRKAFEEDRLRQEELKLAGIDSVRITARRIEREPTVVVRRLKLLLEKRRGEIAARRHGARPGSGP